jgi:peptide/nickel transport system permease protein
MKALKAYLRELGRAVVVFLMATLLIYCLLIVSPGGSEVLMRGKQEDFSILWGYLTWLKQLVLYQDLGETRVGGGLPVLEQVLGKGQNSLIMVGIALVAALFFSWLFEAIMRALRHITVVSTLSSALPYCLSALPAFIVGSYLIQNYPRLIYNGSGSLWLYYLTPGIIMGLADGFLSEMMRHSEEQIGKIKSEGYMLLAKAKGASSWRHMRYEFGLNLSQLIFSKITMLISGTVILEYMFKLPGIGSLVFGGAEHHDINLLLGSLVTLVFVVIVFNFLNKFLWIAIDPRLR